MLENIAMYSEGFDLSQVSHSALDHVSVLAENGLISWQDNLVFATDKAKQVENFDVSLFHVL